MTVRIVRFAVLSTLLLAMLSSPGGAAGSSGRGNGPDPRPIARDLISAHTSGIVSAESAIRVVFLNPIIPSDAVGKPLADSPFHFKPPLRGQARWKSRREIEFQPLKPMPADQKYRVSVDVGALAGLGGEERRRGRRERFFDFRFRTLRQSFDAVVGGLEVDDTTTHGRQRLAVTITTVDAADPGAVEKMATVKHEGRTPTLSWEHSNDRRTHRLLIDGIERRQSATILEIDIDGAPIGVEDKRHLPVAVASLDTFELLDVRAVQAQERFVELRFSDPVDAEQDLAGLVRIGNLTGLRFAVDGSVVRVYTAAALDGEMEVAVDEAVRNASETRLGKPSTVKIRFGHVPPAVRFAGLGVIYPTSSQLTIPIETVNLHAIRIEVTRVQESNLPQFLQVNRLNSDREMQRVGRVVWSRTLRLAEMPSEGIDGWVSHGLDISPLLRESSGGLYHLKLSFRRPDIDYQCADTPGQEAEPEEPQAEDGEPAESSFWDYWEQGGPFSYSDLYRSRHDPCHPGYYRAYGDHNISVSRNVVVSDLGLIAKRGNDDSLLVYATNLRTAQPLPDAQIEVLDYQNEQIASGTTGADGSLRLDLTRKPFLVVGRWELHQSFLKLDDGSALALSHFDVSGAEVASGLKGFIYGERGIWRPGDDIYLTFVLHDPAGKLPDSHPVRFELHDPRGRLVDTQVATSSVGGFYRFQTRTAPEAPTGNYSARVLVGGARFEQTVAVETVMPNRLKIALDLGDEMIPSADGRIRSEFSAAWLHGAPARDLKADVEMTLSKGTTRFPHFADYVFDDPSRDYEPESRKIFEGKLDGDGHATIDAPLPKSEGAPGMLEARLVTRVFEPGGAFSIDRFRVPLSPYQRYVGLLTPQGDRARGMLLTDTKHEVEVVTVGEDGELQAGTGSVRMKIYKIHWRWWWQKGEEKLASYISKSSFKPLAEEVIEPVDGKARWSFEIKYPEWGRYLITAEDVEGGHRSGKIVYIDWPGWAGRATSEQSGGANLLSFSTAKEKVLVGEDIVVNLPALETGRALVSIESGTRVLGATWIEASGQPIRHRFRATAAMAPNVYVHVTVVQPHIQTTNDRPMRLYGIVPVSVVDPQTRLAPKIESNDELPPLGTAEIRVSESEGRRMTYTLALVDEGLLGLTRFQVPDSWSHFYRREALGVKSWDLYDLVAGAQGAALERLLAVGGDGSEPGKGPGEQPEETANRFPPLVRYLGPFELPEGETASHRIELPQYVGAVRLMLVAGHDGAFGSAEKSVFVRKPLMLLGTLPRVLSPDEEVELPVTLFVLGDGLGPVTARVRTEGPLSVLGEAEKVVDLAPPAEHTVGFRLRVGDRTGVARVHLSAEAGPERAEQSIEIGVRMPALRETRVIAAEIGAGEEWNARLSPVGVPGTNDARLEMSRLPPMDLHKRLDFLIRYPYGCVEQTTSSVFPQLYLDKLVELSEGQRATVEQNVRAGIERLRGFQTVSGGFAYWPSDPVAHDWASSYAGHFLLEAGRAGYLVPRSVLDSWQAYQAAAARQWVPLRAGSDLVQAYRLYTLALAGAPESAAMNRLRESRKLGAVARWRLAAAYLLAGRREAGIDLTEGLSTEVEEYDEPGETFASTLRDRGMILETLLLMGENERAARLAREIAADLGSEKWWSTQSLAQALVAMGRFAALSGENPEVRFSYTLNDDEAVSVVTARPVSQAALPVSAEERAEPGRRAEDRLMVRNQSEAPLFLRLMLSGIPAPGEEEASDNGLELEVLYRTTEGDRINPSHLLQGTQFVAEVTVKNPDRRRRREEIALSHLIPAGWEIRNQRLDPSASGQGSPFDYQDIRDDRVYTYFDLDPGQTKTFPVLFHSTYRGHFRLPPIAVEAMYDSSIQARVPGGWATVILAGEEVPKQARIPEGRVAFRRAAARQSDNMCLEVDDAL